MLSYLCAGMLMASKNTPCRMGFAMNSLAKRLVLLLLSIYLLYFFKEINIFPVSFCVFFGHLCNYMYAGIFLTNILGRAESVIRTHAIIIIAHEQWHKS